MSFLNNEEDEVDSDNGKIYSQPSRMSQKGASKENSFDGKRWHSFREELVKENKDGSFSYNNNRGHSGENSENRVHSFVLADKSNSELKLSVASKYVDYLDHYRKVFSDLVKNKEIDESRKEDHLKSKNYSNILLNSTILSNWFKDQSFNDPIHEISNEADFIEEDSHNHDSEEGSFFQENKKDDIQAFSKIYKHLERESFSFENNGMFGGILDELNMIDKMESIDGLDREIKWEKKHFFAIDHEKLEAVPLIRNYDSHEEYIKIQVIHITLADKKTMDEYVLTRNGILNSHKNSKVNSLVIGRSDPSIEKIQPNDIILPYSDQQINRVHWWIVFKYAFKHRKIPKTFVTFLSGRKEKIAGAQCKLKGVPFYWMNKIYSYLKPPHKMYAYDLGTTLGTYKKLVYNEEHTLKLDDIIMVGNASVFAIKYVSTGFSLKYSIEDLYHFLADEAEEKIQIYGLNFDQIKRVEELREKKKNMINEILKEDNESFFNNPNTETDWAFPLLIFEISNGPSAVKKKHIFISFEEIKEFVIGRVPENDLWINSTEISRHHWRILFKDNKWIIKDGTSMKQSMNGTWASFSNLRDKFEKRTSGPIEINDGDQIKISDSIVSFYFQNFNESSQKELR